MWRKNLQTIKNEYGKSYRQPRLWERYHCQVYQPWVVSRENHLRHH